MEIGQIYGVLANQIYGVPANQFSPSPGTTKKVQVEFLTLCF